MDRGRPAPAIRWRPLRTVVTLPPLEASEADSFAAAARGHGAALLELRTDLHAARGLDARALAAILPLVVSARGARLPDDWVRAATFVDEPIEGGLGPHPPIARIASLHAPAPLSTDEALAAWRDVTLADGDHAKHVEPLGRAADAARLVATQRALADRFGADRVTVLATGELALPFRAVLADRNALDYVATPRFHAAAGQRLLADAVRSGRAPPGSRRYGILGSEIRGSRSPLIHRQPFDRIDLPAEAPVGELIDSLAPFYDGFAVTSPFKQAVARHLGLEDAAINTLRLRAGRWEGTNTDIEGAKVMLAALGPRVTVLGDGGVTRALHAVASRSATTLTVLRHADVGAAPLGGDVVWTWPQRVPTPASLRFAGARVATVAYGLQAGELAAEILRRGGTPCSFGPRWFITQARAQRRYWGLAA